MLLIFIISGPFSYLSLSHSISSTIRNTYIYIYMNEQIITTMIIISFDKMIPREGKNKKKKNKRIFHLVKFNTTYLIITLVAANSL